MLYHLIQTLIICMIIKDALDDANVNYGTQRDELTYDTK